MRGTTRLFSVRLAAPSPGVRVLGSLVLTGGLIVAICLVVDDPGSRIPLCMAATLPAYLTARRLRAVTKGLDPGRGVEPGRGGTVGPRWDVGPNEAARVSWIECLLIGLVVFGVVGTAGTLLVLGGVIGYLHTDAELWEGLDPRALGCGVAAATIAGAVAWRMVVATTAAGPRQGARAGLVTGLVAHPLACLMFAGAMLAGTRMPRGQSVGSWAVALALATAWLTAMSLGVLGWISAPLGALLGSLTVGLRRALVPRANGTPGDGRTAIEESGPGR
ncbi:MAG TPA: hypothetical protein VF590_13935 [Isosphaeraceae bacterium]|jgi:hypothetical protein